MTVRCFRLLLLVLALTVYVPALPVSAHPLPSPSQPESITLDVDTPEYALLRWQRLPHHRYHLCFSTNRGFADWVSCSDLGMVDHQSIGIPASSGGAWYLALRGCVRDECSELVPAGVVARSAGPDWDYYAVSRVLDSERVRLAAFVRAGVGTINYYNGRAGAPDVFARACEGAAAAQSCPAVEVTARGALAGVRFAAAGTNDRGITFTIRDAPTIHFMFDDGTGIVSGGRYLMQSVLDEYGVKGSFFLTGKAMQTYPAAVRALVAGGHRVGNHTWSHPFLTSFGDSAIGSELDQTERQYQALIPGGTLRPCFRAPNGAFDGRVLRMVQGRGLRQVTQTVSSLDYQGISAGRITQIVLAEARDGALVSFHTQEMQTAIALRTIVPALLAQGYQFGIPC